MNNADDKSFPLRNIQYLIREALTKTDKDEIKRIAKKEVETMLTTKAFPCAIFNILFAKL